MSGADSGQFRVMREFPCLHVWLDLAGWHARYCWEPKGSPPRLSATTPDALLAAIRAANGELGPLPLPRRIPAPPHDGGRVLRWEPASPETLTRVRAALRQL